MGVGSSGSGNGGALLRGKFERPRTAVQRVDVLCGGPCITMNFLCAS
jgi:hypothetical protein